MNRALALTLLFAGAFAQAQIGSNPGRNHDFFSFDFPLAGVIDTEATSITPSGTIVGRYFTPMDINMDLSAHAAASSNR